MNDEIMNLIYLMLENLHERLHALEETLHPTPRNV